MRAQPHASLPVTFVLFDAEPLEHLKELQPDRDWRAFALGERAWILQTFLRLRARGAPVELSQSLPSEGIAVFSSKQRRMLRAANPSGTRALLVGVRQDVREALIADFEIVQNGHQADNRVRFFLPHWPQPGLLPRDPQRGGRIETIAFKGYIDNLHSDFRSLDWRRFLEKHHLQWQDDAMLRYPASSEMLAWNDFQGVDLMLAVRPPDDRYHHSRKPATKLYNAWLAGVPALLGPEPAYREQRQSHLDYIEVDSRVTAQNKIVELLQHPERYAAMIDRCRQRAPEFTPDAIAARWQAMLFDTLPSLYHTFRARLWRGRSLGLKENSRRVGRLLRLR